MSTLALEVNRLSGVVLNFSFLMMRRIFNKACEGYRGWDDDDDYDTMWSRLHTHIQKAEEGTTESYVDIANLAMFLHNLKEGDR